jgi:chromosome segregation ATPase
MMAQIAVKADEQTFERFKQLKNSLKEAGLAEIDQDAITLLMDAFDDTQLSKQMDFGPSFKELNQIVNRITEIFSNQAKQFVTDRTTNERKYEESVAELMVRLNKAVEEKTEAKGKLSEMLENEKELKNTLQQLEKENTELEERVSEQKEALSVSKQQNETNNRIIAEQVQQLQDMKERVESVEELFNQIGVLSKELEGEKEKHESELKELRFSHEKTLFELKKELQEGFDRKLSEVRTQKEEQASKHIERYNELQEKQQKTFEELKSLEAEHKALLAQLPKNK